MRAVGVDIGSRADWTAVVVADLVEAPEPVDGGRREKPTVTVRALDRWRFEAYPQVVDRLAALCARPALRGAPVVVDSTGVGAAVVDLLRERVRPVEAVIFTGGQAPSSSGRTHRVPKADLVSALDVLVSSHRLAVPASLPLAGDLVRELEDFGYKINERGHTTYDAQGSAHDDLVAAASLAAWWLTARPSHSEAFLAAWKRRSAAEGVPVPARQSWRERAALAGRSPSGPPQFRPLPDGPGAA